MKFDDCDNEIMLSRGTTPVKVHYHMLIIDGNLIFNLFYH